MTSGADGKTSRASNMLEILIFGEIHSLVYKCFVCGNLTKSSLKFVRTAPSGKSERRSRRETARLVKSNGSNTGTYGNLNG